VRAFDLNPEETEDLLAFLKSLTDKTFLSDPRFANPWQPVPLRTRTQPRYILHGEVAAVYKEDGSAAFYHSEVPGLLAAMERPASMEFQVPDARELAILKPGMKIVAAVRRRGSDYLLEQIRPEGAPVTRKAR
jgi:hypothetical protein